MRFPIRAAFCLGLLLSLVPVARASAQCGGSQLCPPGVGICEVTAACAIDSGTTGLIFDLGNRPFVIRSGKTLTVSGTGGITIYAASIELENGAKIFAKGGAGNPGADVGLESPGNIALRASSVIDVSSDKGGGSIRLRSAAAITAVGSLVTSSAGGDASGGNVDIDTFLDNGGNIEIGGAGINASGGGTDSGGFIDINANGSLTIGATLTSRGGQFDGGEVTLAALGGDLLILAGEGAITTTASGSGGYGGDVDLYASGALSIGGPIAASGANGGGNGASIDLVADNGGITFGARVEAAGGGGGDGGAVTATAAGTVTIAGPIDVQSGGTVTTGGTIDISSSGSISIYDSLDVHGGDGGTISVVSDAALTVAGTLNAAGTRPSDGFGGNVALQACGLSVVAGASIVSTGFGSFPFAANVLEASGTMSVQGTVTAGSASRNQLWYRSILPTFNPAKLSPGAPEVLQNPSLPCCIGCPTTTTSSSTTTSTSTTSTSTSSTSSTTVPTTTTSSTTSTTVPSTTSTSIVPTTTTTSSSTSTTSTTATTTTSSSTSTSTSSTTSTSAVPTTTTTSSSTSTTSTTVSTTTTTSSSSSTTSTSVASTTSSTAVTTSTTSSTEPPTTSTSEPTTTTSTAPSTTTTLGEPPTTTTTLPLTCIEMPLEGFDAVDCRLGTLADTLAVQDATALGGVRVARQLTAKVSRARKLVTSARQARKAATVLKRADRQLRSFDRVVDKTAQKGKLPADLRLRLLDLSRATSAQIGVLRAS